MPLAENLTPGDPLAAGDLNGDRFADLAVGMARGDETDPFGPATGVIRVMFGGAGGLTLRRSILLASPYPPDPAFQHPASFGDVLAIGDVNADGYGDIVEGSAASPEGYPPAHTTSCSGGPAGPSVCRPFGGAAFGPAALAVGDVTGDGYGDVIAGTPRDRYVLSEADPAPVGRVRVYRGGRDGPSSEPVNLTQASAGIPGRSAPGDGFGRAVAVADVDRDGYADIVVGAPGEDRAAGAVTFIRGAPSGYATRGNAVYGPRIPGFPVKVAPDLQVGMAVSLVDVNGDGRLDLGIEAYGSGKIPRFFMLRGSGGRFTTRGARSGRLTRSGFHAGAG
jgi:hypothetical protein